MSELLTVAEVAGMLGVSTETVMRKFSKEKGVIDIGSPTGSVKKRRYRVLRIPASVVEKYMRQRGGSGTVTPPERKKPPQPVKQLNEAELARQLAAVTKQHGSKAQQTLDRIAERARLMKSVPEENWQVMVWFDREGEWERDGTEAD